MRRHLPACPAERVLCGSLSVTAGHVGRPWATCASSFPCSPHWLRPLPFRRVPSCWRPNIPFSETVNDSALIICSFYVFYATHGIFLSRDLKVFVPDFALGARLPAWVSLVAQMAKNPPANARETGWIPGSERSPGEGYGNLLPYSCLGNPMDAGAWWATVHGVTKNATQLIE